MSGTTKTTTKSKTTTKKPAAKAKKAVTVTKAAKSSVASKSTSAKKPVKKTVKSPKKSAQKVSRKSTVKKSVASKTANVKQSHQEHHATSVHAAPTAHVPAAIHARHGAKPKISEAWMWVAFFLTFLFVYSVAENVVNIRSGVTSLPSSYAALPAVAMSIVVWKANRTKSTYTGMVVVLSMIGAGLFIWLFGTTNASSLLFR